jgi:nitronate monooxygenase
MVRVGTAWGGLGVESNQIETGMHELVDGTEVDTMLVMRSIGTHRVWANAAAAKCAELEASGAGFEEILEIVSGDDARRLYFEGDLDCGIVSCGPGVGQMHDIPTVKGLFDEMINQASEVVNRLAGS